MLKAQARELAWGLVRAPSHYTLLTACRALDFLQHRQLVGKTTAARWAIDQGIGPSASIAEALATQTGVEPPGSLTAVDVAFIRHTAGKLAIAVMTFPYYWQTMPERCANRLAIARQVLMDAETR